MIDADNLEALLKAIGGAGSGGWSDSYGWDHWTYKSNFGPFPVPGVGTIEVVDVHELGEGDWGGEVYIVFKVTDEKGTTKLFKKTGHYQSYDGTSWDDYQGDFFEVQQVKKYVTVYE